MIIAATAEATTAITTLSRQKCFSAGALHVTVAVLSGPLCVRQATLATYWLKKAGKCEICTSSPITRTGCGMA